MAKFEDGSYSSLPGIALIAKVLAGRCQMRYTRAAVGSGSIPDGATPKSMTEPAGYVMDAKIASISNPVDGECQVVVQLNSADVQTGFYVTSVVLYAEDPDEGEVPYTYLVLENEPEWIRPSSAVVGKLATFDLIAAVGAVDKVTAAIDPESIPTFTVVEQMMDERDAAIYEEMQKLSESAAATVNITIPKEGWVQDADTDGTYALMLDIPVEGVTSQMVPMLNIPFAHQSAAAACSMCSSAQTILGALRVYAQREPESPIEATLTLIGGTSGIPNGDGTSWVLPIATETTAGVVKIGEGISVTTDGTISVDEAEVFDEDIMATDEEASEMFDEVFAEDNAGGGTTA